MDCTKEDLFGDLIYTLDIIPNCVVSENLERIIIAEKIYSLCFLILFLVMTIYKGSNYFVNMRDNSIFVLLDDYYYFAYNYDSDILVDDPTRIEEIIQQNNINILEFIHLFDCCKLSCFAFISKPIFDFFEKILFPMKKWFWRNSKTILYHPIVFGFIFYTPIEYLFSFMTAPCLESASKHVALYLYAVLDMLMSSFVIFIITFMISFISSRRELQSLHANDIKAKAYLFHYHIKKGMIFGFLDFFLKGMLIIISRHAFFDISLDPISNVFWLARALFFLLLIRRSHSRKRIQINCNCDMLKEESKFSQIQNFLFKSRCNLASVMSFNKNKNEFLIEFQRNLNTFIHEKWMIFKNISTVLDGQKFKNIIIKKNRDSSYHVILAMLFIFYFAFSVVITVLSILTLTDNERIKKSCFLMSVPIIGYICLDFMEILLFPYFFYKITKRNNLY